MDRKLVLLHLLDPPSKSCDFLIVLLLTVLSVLYLIVFTDVLNIALTWMPFFMLDRENCGTYSMLHWQVTSKGVPVLGRDISVIIPFFYVQTQSC